MKPQALAVLAGIACAVAGIVFLLVPITRMGVSCGSAMSASGDAAHQDLVNSYKAAFSVDAVASGAPITDACQAARSTRQNLAIGLGIPGSILLIGGLGAMIASGQRRVAEARDAQQDGYVWDGRRWVPTA